MTRNVYVVVFMLVSDLLIAGEFKMRLVCTLRDRPQWQIPAVPLQTERDACSFVKGTPMVAVVGEDSAWQLLRKELHSYFWNTHAIYLLDTSTGHCNTLMPFSSEFTTRPILYSVEDVGDGAHLAATKHGRLVFWNIAMRHEVPPVVDVPEGEVISYMFEPPGRLFAVVVAREVDERLPEAQYRAVEWFAQEFPDAPRMEEQDGFYLFVRGQGPFLLPGLPSIHDFELRRWWYSPIFHPSPNRKFLLVQCDNYPQGAVVFDVEKPQKRAMLTLMADQADYLWIPETNRFLVAWRGYADGDSAESHGVAYFRALYSGDTTYQKVPEVAFVAAYEVVRKLGGLKLVQLWKRSIPVQFGQLWLLWNDNHTVSVMWSENRHLGSSSDNTEIILDMRGNVVATNEWRELNIVSTIREGVMRTDWIIDTYRTVYRWRDRANAPTGDSSWQISHLAWQGDNILWVGGRSRRRCVTNSRFQSDYLLAAYDVQKVRQVRKLWILDLLGSDEFWHGELWQDWPCTGSSVVVSDSKSIWLDGNSERPVIIRDLPWSSVAGLNNGQLMTYELSDADDCDKRIRLYAANRNGTIGEHALAIPRLVTQNEDLYHGYVAVRQLFGGQGIVVFVSAYGSRRDNYFFVYRSLDDQNPQVVTLEPQGSPKPCWLRVGRTVIAVSDGRRLWVKNLAWARVSTCDFSDGAGLTALEVDPESDVVFAGLADGHLVVLDGSSGAALGKFLIHDAPLVCIAPGMAGRLATVATDGQIKVWQWRMEK